MTPFRKKFAIANWKMNFSVKEALQFVTLFLHQTKMSLSSAEIVLAPPFTALYPVAEALSETEIKLAAQNMYWAESGAFTGEISGAFLQDIGVQYVILGHSERRHVFGETDEQIGRKMGIASLYNLIPILCVGETEEEREAGKTFEVLKRQLSTGLQEISKDLLKQTIIAYEPVWAIGTGKTARPSDVQEALQWIREYVKEGETPLLYGGSVDPEKAKPLAGLPNLDGSLVGAGSLSADSFAKIAQTLD